MGNVLALFSELPLRELATGEVLIIGGGHADWLYVMVEGSVEVVRESDDRRTRRLLG